MSPPDSEQAFLSQVATHWSRIFQAGQATRDEATAARQDLLVRYQGAIYRYLLTRMGDPHAAGEILSNFALRVLEGDAFLQRADRERGRFRDYLKAVLWRMVQDYYRGRQRGKKVLPLPPDSSWEPAGPQGRPPGGDRDGEFRAWWRQEVLNQAWKALEEVEGRTGQPYCSAVRFKEDHPEARSAEVAEQLGARLGRPLTAAGVRQILHRGRELFADLLVAETARSLRRFPGEVVPREGVEQELSELGLLLSYCKAALARYPRKD